MRTARPAGFVLVLVVALAAVSAAVAAGLCPQFFNA
jgi:hypothetical protein